AARIVIPAALRYALAVSRRTPVATSMRRTGHPSRPRASTCCFLSSPKMLAMPTGRARSPPSRQRLGALLPHWPVFRCRRLAGFGCPPRDIRTGCPVERILVTDGRAAGVVAGGETIHAARAVLASVTPSALYNQLLPSTASVSNAVHTQAERFRHGRAAMQV